jgi:hypothetical protein
MLHPTRVHQLLCQRRICFKIKQLRSSFSVHTTAADIKRLVLLNGEAKENEALSAVGTTDRLGRNDD